MSNPADLITPALDAGFTSVRVDGARLHMHTRCPRHDAVSPVSMPIKEGRRIVELVFRCPVDGEQFRAPLDSVFLL